MNEPEKVQIAVKEYKQEMDLLAGFMEQCVEIDYDSGERIMASDLFRAYTRWAKQNNEYEMSSKKFFKDIGNKVPDKGRNAKGVFYTNIRLTDYGKEMMRQLKQYSFDDFK